jgi:hypothetical protein
MTVIHLKPQTAIGSFALVTLLLAGTAIGRVLGISFDEALYLTVVFLIGITWAVNRFLLRLPASEQRETEE